MELVGFDPLEESDVDRAPRADRGAPPAHAVAGRRADPARLGRDAAARSSRSCRTTTSARWPSWRRRRESEDGGDRRRHASGSLMGEVGALPRASSGSTAPSATRASATADYREFVEHAAGRRSCGAGRALHGVRRSVLPQRLPARQPDPGLERPRLPRPLARRRSTSCTRPTTSRSSPAGCARRRARPRACWRSARATR